MLVFNLTDFPLIYRNRTLPANGGSYDFPELGLPLSDRDSKLVFKKVISIGALPKWFKRESKVEAVQTLPVVLPKEPVLDHTVTVEEEFKGELVSPKESKKKFKG